MQDDWNGGLRTSPRAADAIVTGAVLAELIAVGAIAVDRSTTAVATPRRIAGLEDLQAEIVDQLAAEPGITCVDALDGLAVSMRERVARRLIRTGVAAERRAGWRRRLVAVALDGDTGPAWVHANLVNKVDRRLRLSGGESVLLHLVRHSSMIGNPLDGQSEERLALALRQPADVYTRYAGLLQAVGDALRATAVAR
ncbi:GPP34 family phosphoprotein [Couchioplanes caeruleus]|nr:GPP34 family phosphoprotein [Couchioplanes caeruleus]